MLNGGNMHELNVTESILEIALRYGRAAGAERVTDLYLVIGELASIVDESVQFYWDIISEGTLASGSTLHFRRIPGQFHCGACDRTYFAVEGLTCPACGGYDIQIVAGEELYIESMEITHAGEPELQPT